MIGPPAAIYQHSCDKKSIYKHRLRFCYQMTVQDTRRRHQSLPKILSWHGVFPLTQFELFFSKLIGTYCDCP